MNRQTKRMQRRQEGRSQTQRAQAVSSARRAQQQEKRKRTSARQFLKEVRQELKKVNWPTRQELIAYTIVVLVSVIVLTSLVFGLDYVFSKAILRLFT
jgi:preprotein translocase subunit SecE